jgi:hemerythrin-like metal-binding protein
MENTLDLNIPTIDAKHHEFLELLSKIQNTNNENFLNLFKEMIEHTKEHFAYEEELMKKHSFYGDHEHITEHKNLLEEMEFFYAKSQKMIIFGKSYINEYAYDKFRRHIINIDSQLAMFLKEKEIDID